MALGVVQVCFGLFPLFGLWAFRQPGGFEPLAVACWRMLFGAVALFAICVAVHGRRAFPARRDLGLVFVCALLGVVLNQVLFLLGLERSTSTNAGLVLCLLPVFTFALAAFARQERASPLRSLGLAVALGGGALLFLGQSPEFDARYGFGNLLMAINALSYSGYLVLSKPLAMRYPPLVVITWVYVLSLVTLPALGPFTGWGTAMLPPDVSARAWWSLAYVLVFPTTLAYLLNVFALSRLRASTTAVYVYVQPLIAALAGWLALDEAPTRMMLVAAACIFAGIWLVSRRPRKPAEGVGLGAVSHVE
jgi:drug/metabolite transporter (DMT)-like permease